MKFFIIPNSYGIVAEYNKFNSHTVERCNRQRTELGISQDFNLDNDDVIVQLWMHGNGSDNWQDHGVPANLLKGLPRKGVIDDEDLKFVYYMPSLWPARMFRDLKEGDKISITINGHELEMKASQLTSRYSNHGQFEEVLTRVAAV